MNGSVRPPHPSSRFARLGSGLGPSLILALALASAGCVDPLSLDGLPCPCAAGWVCCADQNLCVREGASCPEPSLRVTPAAGRVRLGGTLTLAASEPVTWSLEEGTRGGQIGADGTYTAPLRPGPVHLVATSVASPARTARVEIAVGPTRLELLAGRLGGPGRLDGTGDAARLGQMRGIVGDGAGHLYVTSNYGQNYHPRPLPDLGFSTYPGAVRRIDLATAAVSTVVEIDDSRDGALDRLAIDAQRRLYTVAGYKEVLRIDAASGALTRLVPASPGLWLYGPLGVWGDWVYFLRQTDIPAGAGSAYDIARAHVDTGAVEAVAGSLASGGHRDGIGADARVRPPVAAAFDATGALLFSDMPVPAITDAPCVLRRLDPATREVTTLSTLDVCPDGMAIDARGVRYTAKGNINAATGGDKEQLGVRQVLQKSFPLLVSSAWPADGLTSIETQYGSPLFIDGRTLYAADNPHRLIREIGPIETYEQRGYGTIAMVNNQDRLVAGAQAWLGTSDGRESGARFVRLKSAAVDSRGNLHVYDYTRASNSAGSARMIQPDGTVRTTGVSSPAGLAVGAGDRLFVFSRDDQLEELTATGRVRLPVTILDGATGGGPFYLPRALTGDERAVYVLDQDHVNSGERIRRYDIAAATVRTLAAHPYTDSTGAWNAPLTTDGRGNVLVTSQTKVYRIDGTTGATTEIDVGDVAPGSITAVAYDPAGVFYVAESQHVSAVVESTGERFPLIGVRGAAGVRTGPLPAFVNGVSALAVLPSGELVLTSSVEGVVLVAR